MGALTEVEIFDCLKANFRLAAQLCDDLAKNPRKGLTYRNLRDALRLVEGACKQAAAWRADARWLKIAFLMGEAHKRAGGWLRGYKDGQGRNIKMADGHLHPLFVGLAENLRKGYVLAEQFQNRATGVVGRPILPTPLEGPHRDTRPVHISGYNVRPSGLVIPSAA
jgi:hypothetical protein